jgi:hypothetical protein
MMETPRMERHLRAARGERHHDGARRPTRAQHRRPRAAQWARQDRLERVEESGEELSCSICRLTRRTMPQDTPGSLSQN